MLESLIDKGFLLLDNACDANRHREHEIMQGIDGEKEHALVVLSWVRKFEQNPSQVLQIAALFHDVDRIVTPGAGSGFKGDRKSKAYGEHKKAHAQRSASYIAPLLTKEGVPQASIERITFLIVHHDDTGEEIEQYHDRELSVLVAADSLAFFTSIAPKLYEAEGEARLKDKVRFMIEKMPAFARHMLSQQILENTVFERVKREVLQDFS